MDKQLFDDAIGEVPPSTVDVDAAIARGRRAAWTRRVASPMVAVAAGVVLVAGGAVALTLPGDDPVPAAQIQPTGTTTPATPAKPTEPPADVCTYTQSTQDAPRLTEALSGALQSRGLLAGAALTVDPAIEELAGPGTSPLQFLPSDLEVANGCGGYSAVGVVDGAGRFTVSVAQVGGALKPEVECLPAMGDCQRTTGPNGEEIVSFTSGGAHRVDIVKNGTVVILAAENHRGGVAPPLTREQLTEVGLDAGLTLNS